MEYLKTRFHDELSNEANLSINDSGQVSIRGRCWRPEEILQEMSPEIYVEVFEEWIEDRRQSLLGAANSILESFEQKDRFEALKGAYRRGAVIPFVGAGMSEPSGYPGWKNFLVRLRRQTTIPEDQFLAQLSRGEYEEAAQLLADALGAGFNEEVENAFGVDRDLIGPVQLLPYIFDTAVITTNFDSVLKRCFDNAGRAFEETIPGHQGQELLHLLGRNQRLLLKVHGRAMSGVGRVLTATEYDAAYGEHLPAVVETFCSRPLLFLGCGLSVDRLLSEIRRFVEAKGHGRVPRHYAFLSAPESEGARIARKTELAKFNIYPIWYPTGEHDDSIEALLYALADGITEL